MGQGRGHGEGRTGHADSSDRNHIGLVLKPRPKPDQKPDQTRPDQTRLVIRVWESRFELRHCC